MNRLTTVLLCVLFAGSFLLFIPSIQLNYAFSQTSNATTISSSNNTMPVIFFPTQEEVKMLFEQKGYQNTPISNITNGPVINIKAIVDRNGTIIVVWLDDKDRVWLAVSHGDNSNGNYSTLDMPRNFTEPIVLTDPNSKNVTNLQIATDDYETAVVWQSYNQTTAKNNIFGALTQDGGATWAVYIISNEQANAENPLLVNPKVVFYVGENEQACENPYDSSAVISSGMNGLNSSAVISSGMNGLNIACFHPW